MIARQKAANEPLAPAGPSSLPRGPPRSQGSATDYSYDYNPQPSQPSRGVIYPNVPNVQLKSVSEIELNEIETIQPEENSTQNGSEKLIIMIGIGTGVIAVISLVIVLLIYFHRKIKKQEREDQEITQQKYMFDHTVLSRNQSVEKGPVPKEQVHKPRDFMDEDDVEMVRTLSRAPAKTSKEVSLVGKMTSASSFVSSKDSGIDAKSSRTKSYVTSLRSSD